MAGPRSFVVKKATPAVPAPKVEDRGQALWMQNVRERLDSLEKLTDALRGDLTGVQVGINTTTATPDAPTTSAVSYAGFWDASTGLPPSTSPTPGSYWKVVTRGTTALSLLNQWEVGDWVVYQADGWQRVGANSIAVITESFLLEFDSPASSTILALPGSSYVVKVVVAVETAFDTAATVTLGITGDLDKYVTTSDVYLSLGNNISFEIHPTFQVAGVDEDLIVTYNALSASIGTATIVVSYITLPE